MTHELPSGNIFEYTHERVAGRGGLVKGSFVAPPNEQDIAEARAFMAELAGAPHEAFESITRESDAAAMDEMRRTESAFRTHLYGGSTN